MIITPAAWVTITVFTFIFGTVVGSFLNVCTFRIPRRESLVAPGSHCMNCESAIAWYDNIPVLSYLILRGRCRQCMARISPRYFLVELGTGCVFLAVLWRFRLTPALLVYWGLLATLIVVTIIDLERYIIPGRITLAGIIAGLAIAACISVSGSRGGLLIAGLPAAVLGLVVGGGSLWLVDQCAVRVLKKTGMGGGDIRLLAMLGTFLGWRQVLVIVFLASVSGAAVGIPVVLGRRRPESAKVSHYIPFGPFLALGGAIALFFGDALVEMWYSWITVVPSY